MFRGERSVTISPKAFALLELLVGSRPGAVSKTDIHDAALAGNPCLRGEPAQPRGRVAGGAGRRRSPSAHHPDCGPLRLRLQRRRPAGPETGEAEPGTPRLAYRLVWGRREIALDPGENLIGRDRDAVVWIDDDSVSRRHARILIGEEGATIEDLGSKNGTAVGDRKINEPTRLTEKDVVRIGPATLTLRILKRMGSTLSSMRSVPRGESHPGLSVLQASVSRRTASCPTSRTD